MRQIDLLKGPLMSQAKLRHSGSRGSARRHYYYYCGRPRRHAPTHLIERVIAVENLSPREPWETLEMLIEINREDEIIEVLDGLDSDEKALALSRVSSEDQARLLAILGPEESAHLVDTMSDAQATEIIEDLPAAQAAAIVDQLPSDEQADLLAGLDERDAQDILDQMEPEEASDARRLLEYRGDTAGGLMISEYLSYASSCTVGDVTHDIREHRVEYADYNIQYVYVTDDREHLVGVLRLRDLLLARDSENVKAVMIEDPHRVDAETPRDRLNRIFDEYAFLGIPVVDEKGKLVGVVERAAIAEAMSEEATRQFLSVSGLVGEDELRSMPLLQRSFRRLSWLSLNIVLNVVAASVIAIYQDTLTAVIALVVFLPIISDMSGCSGNQAVAVSIRELSLGLVKPYEFLRVFMKEASVGVINGLLLGVLLGAVAALWQGNIYLGLVVGAALLLNTMNAVVLGGLIPLALKRMNMDPALASGPILTTVTDMMGFFLVLSFATAMLAKLV